MSDDADELVARAIDRVLDQVPGTMDTAVPESAAKLQPWAETAAPPSSKTKRPLEEMLAELEASVAENPGAVATLPSKRHPALAFFDRFSRSAREATREGTSRRRRRRRGGGTDVAEPARGAVPIPSGAPSGDARSGRRRRRRGRGGSGGSAAGAEAPRAAAPSPPQQQGASRPPGSGRRRRGRRGRGGGNAGGGGGGQRPATT